MNTRFITVITVFIPSVHCSDCRFWGFLKDQLINIHILIQDLCRVKNHCCHGHWSLEKLAYAQDGTGCEFES